MLFELAGPVVIGTLVTGLIILVGAGLVARGRLARRYPPTGRLVAVDGRRVHVDARGDGPVVVLEAGTWAPGRTWEPVQQRLAAEAHVIAYDRPGLGWSDPSPRRRTPIDIADELAATLDAVGVRTPVILVGHSFGGVVIRVFAARHPGRVAGLVLVDAAHETQFERFPEPIRLMNARMSRVMPLLLAGARALVALGIVALRPSMVPASLGPLSPATIAAIRGRVAAAPSVVAAMAAETRDLEAGFAQVRALGIDAPGVLGDIPVRVLTHGRPEPLPPQMGDEVAAAYEATWQDLQASLAALSSDGRQLIAEGTGHAIPAEAPDLVVDAVRELLTPAPTRRAIA